MENDDKYVQLDRVRIGVDGVAEMDGERPLVAIPRTDIVGIDSTRAVGGERPIVTLILGFILLGVAIVPVLALIDVWRRGGTYHVEWIGAVACVIPAIWLIELSVRRRWVLLVTTRRERRKLLFARDATQVQVESFVAAARSRFGYS